MATRRTLPLEGEFAVLRQEMVGLKTSIDQVDRDVREMRADREKYYTQQIEISTIRLAQTDLGKRQSSFENYMEERMKNLITKDQFDPVRLVVYRTLGTILGAFVLAIATLVLSKGGSILP